MRTQSDHIIISALKKIAVIITTYSLIKKIYMN